MKVRQQLAAILFLCAVICQKCWARCDVDSVAVYRMTLSTFWNEETFPKDYPANSQWSQVFGQSHNSSYTLYRVGEVTKDTVNIFSKTGKVNNLVEEGEEEPKVYDQFLAAALDKGVANTENMLFVDQEHSYVSLICRLVPSPDWFVGVDSIDLCLDSSWIDELALDLHPLDAGTASGLTFTSPFWETKPSAAVSRIGPRTSEHPGSGFYYPELRELPAIAQLHIAKVKEYTTKELNEMARKELFSKLYTKKNRKTKTNYHTFEDNHGKQIEFTTKGYVEKLKNLEEDPVGTPRPNNPDNDVEVVTEGLKFRQTDFGGDLHNMDEVVLAVAKGRHLGLRRHLPRHFRSRLHHAVNRITPDDCLVSKWGEWSSCSKTCGVGEKYRSRTVVRYPTQQGRACPELNERRSCGSANSCEIDYSD